MKITIENPCSAAWSGMSGDNQRRFCGQCKKHVHNLSEMTTDEAKLLLCGKRDLCVRYESKEDESIGFRPSRGATWFFVAATVSATACDTVAELPDPEVLAIESLLEVEGMSHAWVPPEPVCESSKVELPVDPVVVKSEALKPGLDHLFSGVLGQKEGLNGLLGVIRDGPAKRMGVVAYAPVPEPARPPEQVLVEAQEQPELEAPDKPEQARRGKKRKRGQK